MSDDGRYEGRKASATMKSLAGAYEAIAAWGVVPEICEMGAYDWSNPQGKNDRIDEPHGTAFGGMGTARRFRP